MGDMALLISEVACYFRLLGGPITSSVGQRSAWAGDLQGYFTPSNLVEDDAQLHGIDAVRTKGRVLQTFPNP